MTDWLFPPAPTVFLPVAGHSARFPVRRILCVGQNYAAHAREMGHARAEPFFFTKPTDAVVVDGADPVFPMARLPAALTSVSLEALDIGWPFEDRLPDGKWGACTSAFFRELRSGNSVQGTL